MNPTYPPTTGESRHLTLHGYPCALQMGPYSINGYITLPADHPWLQADPTTDPTIDVHGAIRALLHQKATNHSCDGYNPESEGYKHIAAQGGLPPSGHVWSWEEVVEETKHLAWLAHGAEEED